MTNIEEFRASLIAKRDLARKLAENAERAYALNHDPGIRDEKWTFRGRAAGLNQALEMAKNVDTGLEALANSIRELHVIGTWQGEGRWTGIVRHYEEGFTYTGCLECETSGPCATLMLLPGREL